MASEIVIGVDFGTTYSGVSWAINSGTKKIRVVTNWQSDNQVATAEKVPSCLTYKNRTPNNWGYTVTSRDPSLSWFKLLLDEKNKIGRDAEKVVSTLRQLEALGKAPEDVAADYLRLAWNWAKEDINRVCGSDWLDIYTIKAVLTVPAIWSESAKARTLRIAKRAGIPDNVSLVSEPEAAALATLRERKEEGHALQVGDCFVVCDAGGGTVDLISYKISALDPFQVEECAVGAGDLCGSIYLDKGFENHIKLIVGKQQWDALKFRSKQKMMLEFENKVKKNYTGDEREFQVELQGVRDDPSVNIDDEMITLSPLALKTIFDHVINKIMHLVENQIDEVKDNNNDVKAILLVGGFGTNRYLHKRLNEAYRNQSIKVLETNGGWSSICRGATMWGLENSHRIPALRKTVKSRIARYSYGVICQKRFNYAEGHLDKDRAVDQAGYQVARNQMIWKVRRGDKIDEGTKLHVALEHQVQANSGDKLHDNDACDFQSDLYYCADIDPPTRAEPSVKVLCTLEYSVPRRKLWTEQSFINPMTGETWRKALFDFEIGLENTTLSFSITYKNEEVARTKAKYKEDF